MSERARLRWVLVLAILASCLPRPDDVPGSIAGPTSLGFGSLVGQTGAAQEFFLQNKGPGKTAPLGKAVLSGVGAERFEIVSDTCAGRVLLVSEFCGMTVRFTATDLEPAFAELSIDAAHDGPVVTRISGTGVLPTAFAPKVDIAQQVGGALALGDLDGTGRIDLAMARGDVRLNTTVAGVETPTFAASINVAMPGQAVALADLNNDDKQDFVIANDNGMVFVLLNTTTMGAATPSFAPIVEFPISVQPVGVAIGDLNGDGSPDLAVVSRTSNVVSVLINETVAGSMTPDFADKVDVLTVMAPQAIAIGDLNGDGKQDLAVAISHNLGAGGPPPIAILLNTTISSSTLSFAQSVDVPVGAREASRLIALADFDRDGRLDVAFHGSFGTITVLLNETMMSATTPSFRERVDFTGRLSTVAMAVGDLNDDGALDIAATDETANVVGVFLNATAGAGMPPAFVVPAEYTTGPTPGPIAIGDIAGDGKPDMIVGNGAVSTVSILVGR